VRGVVAFVTRRKLSDARLGELRRGEVVMIPIRATPAKRSKKPAEVTNRSNEVTGAPTPGDVLKMLKELRSELRCLGEAILTLERLAINRLPERRRRPPKWMSVAKLESRSRYKGRSSVSGQRGVVNKGDAKSKVVATA
jgi:hypothetical protein